MKKKTVKEPFLERLVCVAYLLNPLLCLWPLSPSPGRAFSLINLWPSFILVQIKLIFSTKVFLSASFWKWELFELGKGLIGHFRVPPGLCMKTRWSTQRPFVWKWFFILMQINLIFIRKVVHLASFWKWGFLELGSGLLRLGDKRDEELTWVKKNYLNLILTRRGPFILFWCYRPML